MFFTHCLCGSWVFSTTPNCWAIRLQKSSRHVCVQSQGILQSCIQTRGLPCYPRTKSLCAATSSPVSNPPLFVAEALAGTHDYRPCNADFSGTFANTLVLFRNSCRLPPSWECSGERTHRIPACITPSSDKHWYYKGTLTPAVVCGSPQFPAAGNLGRARERLRAAVSVFAARQTHRPVLTAAVSRYRSSSRLLQPALPCPFRTLIQSLWTSTGCYPGSCAASGASP